MQELTLDVAAGSPITDRHCADITLQDCNVEVVPTGYERPLIQDVSVRNLVLSSTRLSGALLRRVEVRNVKADSVSRFLYACAFEEVRLSGRIGTLVLDITDPMGRLAHYLPAIRKAEAGAAYTLDVSEIRGSLDVRGYDASRMIIDPSFQAVVWAEDLRDSDWRGVLGGPSRFSVLIEEMLRENWPNVLLSANIATARRSADLELLKNLRCSRFLRSFEV
ncbi:hypothetical protein ACIPVB_02525 [Microbacterium sp. NPDC090007]|uniref:hypothetical protein n=1 Tax=Microbacterium sp. NPDC090007 TaxID=3364204 RepID=UPI0038184D06